MTGGNMLGNHVNDVNDHHNDECGDDNFVVDVDAVHPEHRC